MKYGFNINFWFTSDWLNIDIHRALDEISLTGWDGIELVRDQLEIFYDDHEYFANLLKLHNLEITSYYSWLNLVDNDSRVLDLNCIKRKCDFLGKLGCEILLIDGGARGINKNDNTHYKYAIDLINEIGRIAKTFEMKCSWHFHKGSIFDKVKDFEYLMNNTDPDLIGFCPDTAQLFLCKMNPLEIIKKYANRINYIHFKDIVHNNFILNTKNIRKYLRDKSLKENNITKNLVIDPFPKYKYLLERHLDNGADHINSEFKFIEVGRGIIDFGGICKEIKKMHYNGWIVVDQDYTEWSYRESLDVNLKNIKYFMSL